MKKPAAEIRVGDLVKVSTSKRFHRVNSITTHELLPGRILLVEGPWRVGFFPEDLVEVES